MTHISTETSSWPDPKNGGNITWRSSVNVCPHYWAMKAQMPHQDKVNIYRSTSSFPSSPKLTGISHTLRCLSVIRLVFWKLFQKSHWEQVSDHIIPLRVLLCVILISKSVWPLIFGRHSRWQYSVQECVSLHHTVSGHLHFWGCLLEGWLNRLKEIFLVKRDE